MNRGVRRTIIYGTVGVALAGAAVWAFRPQPQAVDIATVKSRPMNVMIEEDGRTRVKDLYTVSAPVAGRLKRVDLEVGDPVKAGHTILATIVPSAPSFLDKRGAVQAAAQVKAAEASVSEARARIEQANAQLAFAKKELNRARDLRASGTVTASRLETAERDYSDAQATLDSAKASLRARRMDLEVAKAAMISPEAAGEEGGANSTIDVVAPIDGQVLTLHQKSSKVVASGTPLMDIGNETNLEVVADFLSADAVKVRPGARAEFTGWGGDAPIAGRVRRIEPTGFTKVSALGVEEQRVNIILDIDSKEAQAARVGPGYRLVTRIEVWASDGPATVVPIDALFRKGDAWAVFTVQDGHARLTPVKLGRRNDEVAQVTGGLAKGDTVIVHPGRTVEDGSLVVPRD